jgi:hypothetical protein
MAARKYPAMITSSKELAQKIETKKQLAAKYYRLAKVASSIRKQETFLFHAHRFENQVRALSAIQSAKVAGE